MTTKSEWACETTEKLEKVTAGEGTAGAGPLNESKGQRFWEGWNGSQVRLGMESLKQALVLSGMVEDLPRPEGRPGETKIVARALRWACLRIVHWLSEGRRCGQEAARLKCLAEAACANMAFRGLVYEETAGRGISSNRGQVLLSQSRRLGVFIGRMCETAGRAAAASGGFESDRDRRPDPKDQGREAREAVVCWRK